MVILSLCVIKQCYLGNYRGMQVNYRVIGSNNCPRLKNTQYSSNLIIEKEGTVVNYSDIFITLVNTTIIFTAVIS
jgi:hypothetical protein